MGEKPISVTTAARKFSDCINLVRYHGASFLLEKNGVPVARIVPACANIDSQSEQFANAPSPTGEIPPDTAKPEHNSVNSREEIEEARPNQKRRPILNW
jgi:antitoxin (DNA-binding transcriptional repressor) of toxin-antitoxin stability system